MITQEKRIKISIFIYRLNRFLKDTGGSVDNFRTVERLTKLKEIIEWMRDFFPNFISAREEELNTWLSQETETNYDDMLEDVIVNHSIYGSLNSLSKEDFIAKMEQMIVDEFRYEMENHLLPGLESKGLVGMIGTGKIADDVSADISCPYDNHNYTYTLDEITQNYIRLTVEGRHEGRKKERFLNIDFVSRFNYIAFSITPSPRDYNEKEWLRKLLVTILTDYTSFTINIDFFVEKINAMISEINLAINRLNAGDADSSDVELSQSENSSFNPASNIRSYSHRTVSIPVVGNFIGAELEFSGVKEEIFKLNYYFERLINSGWILENDASVTFEMKSPIMGLTEIQSIFNQNKILFKTWASLTNPEQAGLHFHIAMDDRFSIGKRPSSRTKLFLLRIAQMFESTILKDSDSRKTIFKRDYQSYCREYGESDNYSERYRWVNFQNLERDVGKTIEIRLFSSAAASELDEAAEKALLIVKFFKSALKDWRAKNRPEFMQWQEGFNGQKIFKSLISNEDLKRWKELFIIPVKSLQKAV